LQIRDPEQYIEQCKGVTPFLHNNYTDIFNRIVKDELDLELMTKLLIVLKLIEDGKVDQNEGSVMVGKVLKELYVDSALKTGEHLDEKYADGTSDNNNNNKETKPITWKEYKNIKGT
jgi:hypothetical protein